MLTEHHFYTGVVTLNYAEREASGPPLVLLHGGSARWQSALPLIPELSRSWQVYAPDLRGHGQSGRVPGRYRLRDYAAHGGALTDEEIEHALTLLPSAMVARMETVGHPLHTQEKEPVLLAMTAFLKTL